MIDAENKLMLDCYVSTHSAYFEGGFNPSFHKKYKGVIVNARGYGGYGHFAIRKPITFWFKFPKFIKKMFPYRWIMWKKDRERMYSLYFNDYDRSVNIVAAMTNPSYRKLSFDKATYKDLKSCIPAFLFYVGYKFSVETEDDIMTLHFEYPELDDE